MSICLQHLCHQAHVINVTIWEHFAKVPTRNGNGPHLSIKSKKCSASLLETLGILNGLHQNNILGAQKWTKVTQGSCMPDRPPSFTHWLLID